MKKSEFITIRVAPEVKTYFEKKAAADERTLSWLINKVLIEYVKGR